MDRETTSEPEAAITADDAVAYLNALNRLDPTVLPALMRHRVTCNADFAYHPTVQVGARTGIQPAQYEVGILGILNGLFGVDERGSGYITAMVDEEDRIVGFQRTRLDS